VGTDFVTSVAFDPGGDRVFVASVDGRVHVWDTRTGRPVGDWACHEGPVNAVAVDPEQAVLLTAGHDGTACVLRLADGALVRRLGGPGAGVLDVAPLGGRVAVAGYDGTIRVWELDGSGDPRVLAGHGEAVTSLWAPAGDTLVSGSRDRTVRTWDVASGGATVRSGHGYWVTRVRPAGAGADTVSAGEDGRLVRWAGRDGPAAWSRPDIGTPIWGLACDAAGRRAVAGAAGATWVVDLASGSAERLADLDGQTFRGIACAPDGSTVALGSDRGRVLLYDLDARAVGRELRAPAPGYLSLAAAAADRGVAGRADGAVVLVAGGRRTVVPGAHGTFVYAARRLDADRFATGGFDGVVRVWDLETGGRAALPHGGEAFSLSAPAAGDRLVVAGGGRTAVWDLAAGREAGADERGDTHGFAAVDAAGTRLAVVGESDRLTIRCLPPGDGTATVWELPDDYGCAVEWVPDPAGTAEHQVVVATAHGRLHLVEAATGAARLLHAGHEDWVRQLRVSPDGRHVASTSQNGVGRVFDLHEGTLVGQDALRGRAVAALDVTPTGEIVALDTGGGLAHIDLGP
jgi:WD40 repeat protein